ncbi:putative membrane channel [Kosakonia phage Kc263]|uniref:Membrane channel n=1 Tax=Kosakonia phage Kc263 TaxID=2863194 RepID=A0AAE8BEI7_9CAUD|nr:putative membrane channel [Kosakonia phage Kc263]QYN79956.1 putative membrane channel [Kosakonia phage Kc263]
MEQSTKDKLSAINTIAILVMLAIVVGWLIFKPDNGLSKSTVDKLTVAIDKVGVAAENMNKVAIAQQAWSSNLQKNMILNDQNRNDNYENLYGKYGYVNQDTSVSLNDIYSRRLHSEADNNGSGKLRPDQNGVDKAKPVQKPAG